MDLKKRIIVTLYVDDVLIINRNKAVIKRIKDALNAKFHMSNLRSYAFYLNMIVRRDRRNGIIRLEQKIYITRFLNHFKCWNLIFVNTSLETNRRLTLIEKNYVVLKKLREEYQFVISSLIYVMLKTRFDIAYAISLINRYSINPTSTH